MDQLRRSSVADRLAALGGLAAILASLAGFVPGLYRDTSYTIAGSHGQDTANLLGAGVLWIALVAASRGSLRGRLVAVGALGYLLYSYTAFAYVMLPNAASLLYYAVLGFAIWSFVAGLASANDGAVHELLARMPRRTIGVVFVATALLFGSLWLGQIAATVSSGQRAADLVKAGWPTSPYYANDLAVVLPLLLVVGIWMWTRRPIAVRLAVPLLVFAALMDASIFATLVSGALANEATFEPGVGAIFIVHAAVCTGLAAVSLLPGRRSTAPRGYASESQTAMSPADGMRP